MASVNKVILLGHLGKDPEIRYLPSGQAVATASLATSSRRKDRNSGEMIEDTQWHRLVFYERLAEIAGEYCKKGNPIFIEGRLKYGKYDKDGQTHYTTDIVVTSLQLLGSRDQGQGGGNGGGNGGGQQPRQQAQGNGQQRNGYADARGRQQPPAQQQRGGSGFDDMDDDIPFMDPLKRRGYHLAI